MEGIPRVIEQEKTNFQHSPRFYTEKTVEQTQVAIKLVREELATILDLMTEHKNELALLLDSVPQMKKELAHLQQKTAAALEDYKNWLQNDLLPRSDGNFRLGAEKFRKKLLFFFFKQKTAYEM